MTNPTPPATSGPAPGQPSPPLATDRELLSRIGWDLSPFDTRAHAVDPLDQHLTGVYVALCDAKMPADQLHPLPNGGVCVDCAQRIVASRVTNPRWAKLPGDARCHVLGPPSHEHRWQGCRCGARTHPNGLQILKGGPHGLLCTRCVLSDQTDSPHRTDTPRSGKHQWHRP